MLGVFRRFVFGVAVFSLIAPAALAEAGEQWSVLHVGRLLAVPGEAPIERATVVVKDGRIAEVLGGYAAPGELAGAREATITLIDLTEAFVTPGFIDCHTHITMEMSPKIRMEWVQLSEADWALRGAAYAKRTLEAGFTTIRNVGSNERAAFALRDAIEAGHVPGPRILCAGHSITPTGGHGDTHGYREDLFELPTAFQGVADGVDGCRKAVRAQVKRGADVIKITATGGVLSATNAGTEQQFFDDELEAIVETAHLLGRTVAAHAHGTAGINAALRAGVDSIEHGSLLDEESISLFKKTGAYLVPTLMAGEVVVAVATNFPDEFPAAVREKALMIGPAMMKSLGNAHREGVRIAFGTDSGVSAHGDNAREFELMVEAGMSEMDAIHAATINAAKLCGIEDEVGTIEVGKAADLVAVQGDPLKDIGALKEVMFVMRGGEVVKK